MCLSVAVDRPDDVLAEGEHRGFEWMVVHNGGGHRCGYVRVPKGHPWSGKDGDEIDAEVHGGLSFARADKPCGKAGPDDAWWIGFDCAHGCDLPDFGLPGEHHEIEHSLAYLSFNSDGRLRGSVKAQEYVEAECRSLCEQAAGAAP